MTGTIVCAVCGTVNVGVFARCIACGQELGRAVASGDDSDTATREKADVPLQPTANVSRPSPARPQATPSSSSAGRPRSLHAEEADIELDSASFRQTVIEIPKSADTAQIKAGRTAAVIDAMQKRAAAAAPPAHLPASSAGHTIPAAARDVGAPPSDPSARFTARLLLPEGDRRAVDIGREPLVLGSGMDEIGLPGDPRATPGEAKLLWRDGRILLEPAPGAVNIYRRIEKEVKLEDGDVVLMGDIAATFTNVDPGGAVDATRQVLGGSSNAPCGRLVFLRRDGSPGPVHDLPAGKTVLGRTDGHLNFPNDTRLSRRHALFFASDQGVTVEDMDSRNGTYLRVRATQELRPDDALRVGSAGIQIRAKS